MSNNAHDLSNRLLNALDNNYNVVDMQAVNEIISILEKFNITKELLETTRLGKHVNELRRKTTDPTLARRAKVLVKRWRDLVIPTVASPGHTGSNRSSAERQMRRLGGTPLTSPALSRVVSPAVNSPRPPSRPAWGGYESDSQDVILVDDDPPPAPLLAPPTSLAPPTTPHKPLTPPVKRPTSPVGLHDEKKAKRDKKPKRRRGHSRAGSGTEAPGAPPAPAPPSPAPAASAPGGPWGARNGASERRRNGYRRDKLDPYAALVNKLPPAGAKKVCVFLLSFYFNKALGRNGDSERRRNGYRRDKLDPYAALVNKLPPAGAKKVCVFLLSFYFNKALGRNGASERRSNGYRRDKLDPYAALVNKLPPAGAKKVKTTKELLEEIQSRGASAPAPAAPPESADNDVMLVEPAPCPIKVDSPLRNGGSPSPPGSPLVPLEDEREYSECTCGEEPSPRCPAAAAARVRPHHVTALHHAYLPGVNGTRAPLYPHKFAVRAAARADDPSLFASVVPLYNYSDYADDYCAKNMYKVPICESIPMCTFAPPPLSPPPPPSPPPPRPYPLDPDPDAPGKGEGEEMDVDRSPEKCLLEETSPIKYESIKIEPEAVGAPPLEPSERLKAPLLAPDEAPAAPDPPACPPPANQPPAHRTVEKTKEEPELDGRALYDQCRRAIDSIPYDYAQLRTAPEITLPVGVDNEEEAQAMVDNELEAEREDERDELGRPVRPRRFAEWHECARLGSLVALPYVVID